MRSSIATCATLFACTVLAAPSRRPTYAVKETHYPPAAWKRIDVEIPEHIFILKIGLKQPNFDKLEEHLSQISDPFHRRYGAHLTAEQVNDLVSPSAVALDAVQNWLAEFGFGSDDLDFSPAKDWITIKAPLSTAERMLDTKYSVFEHGEDGDRLIRTPKWSLPVHLHQYIDVIQPTNSFFRPAKQASNALLVDTFPLDFKGDSANAGVPKVCNESFVTPDCLRTFYNTIDYKAKAADKNSMGLNNFLGEVNNRSDTSLFLKQFRPEAAGAAYTFQTEVINGGNNYQGQENTTSLAAGADIEGDLDSETMLGIAWPTKLTTFNTGGSPPFKPDLTTPTNTNEPYLDWLSAVLKEKKLPYVISSSYADDEQTVPKSYARKVCGGFAQLGARGISLFFGSGDFGVGKSGLCFTNDGKNTSTFLAMFPASCPFVTTVGGTRGFDPEIVAFDTRNGYVSGGGFSRYFKRPRYQDIAVPAYVKSLGGQFNGLYNPDGRGYPDVAAQGYRFAIVWNGTTRTVDGTSAATPAFTAVVALINDALIAAGRPVLGFLKPFIYAKGFQGLMDVTQGSAAGCNTTGFPAKKGWDAVTGFGTPDFKKLVALAKSGGYGYHPGQVDDGGLN